MLYWQFNRAWCIKEVQRLVRVAGLGYSDGARNLEVMLESLSGGRRREIQEDGIVMEVKKNLFRCSRRSWRETNWVRLSAKRLSLVFLGLSVLDLGPTYATDRQTSDVRRASSVNASYPMGGGIINNLPNATRLYAGVLRQQRAVQLATYVQVYVQNVQHVLFHDFTYVIVAGSTCIRSNRKNRLISVHLGKHDEMLLICKSKRSSLWVYRPHSAVKRSEAKRKRGNRGRRLQKLSINLAQSQSAVLVACPVVTDATNVNHADGISRHSRHLRGVQSYNF